MSAIIRRDIQIPVIITHDKKHCDIYIPDMDITVHGHDYVDTLSNAIMKASAIYYYNLERDLKLVLNTTYAQAEKLCATRKGSFTSYIGLTA
jgi:hypothetical protein